MITKKKFNYYMDTAFEGKLAALGVNVSKSIKTKLQQEAARRGLSVSLLTVEVLAEMLVECGYPREAAQMKIDK